MGHAEIQRADAAPPWERIEGESAKAYAAFCQYRNMPTLERSIRGLAEHLHRNPSQLGQWSSGHGWVARAEAYDEHIEQVALKAQDARVAEMAVLRADFAIDTMTMVLKRIRGDEEGKIAPLDVGKLNARDIAALAGAAEKVGASFDRVKAEKASDDRTVNLKLSFDMTPNHGAVNNVIDVQPHAELTTGDE